MTLSSHPTSRDEDWRYADAEALAEAPDGALTRWSERTVAAGETHQEVYRRDTGAEVTWSVERMRYHVGAGGRLEYFVINAGGRWSRIELEVTLEEGAHFELGGLTIGGGDNVQEIVTRVRHVAPGASSNQVVRAVQWGRSTGNFLGRIEVARDAQHTDAAQSFRALLLERGASANAKPELEIFADDVKCAHGAAIGALDAAAEFYMAARGLPPERARALLVEAFVAETFAAIENSKTRKMMTERALWSLEQAG